MTWGRTEDAIGQIVETRQARIQHEIENAIMNHDLLPARYVQIESAQDNKGKRLAPTMDQMGSPMTAERRAELAAERLKTAIRDEKGEIIGYQDQLQDTQANWDAADWSTPKTIRRSRTIGAGGPPGPLLTNQPIADEHLAILRELGLIKDTPHAAPEPRTVPGDRRDPQDGSRGPERSAVGQRELDGLLWSQREVGWGVPAPRDGHPAADRQPAGDPEDPARVRGGVPDLPGEVR